MTLTLSSAPGVSERADLSALECLVIVGAMQGLQLTVPQLVQDNALESAGIDYPQLVHCARHAGLKAKALHLDGDGLAYLEKAVPAIVRLKSGASMVLVSMNAHYEEHPRCVTLRDPNAAADALLTLDWLQFQEAWSGDVALVRREYHVLDEEKPFGMGLIGTLILRERKLVRDIALSAFALSIFALAPIIFWMAIGSRVLYYKSMSTFAVLCIGMGVIILFETAFTYLRGFLLLFLAARVDTRLSEYIFDRVIQLPVDYFERVQLGETMHDFNEIWKICEFLTGQLFGVVLDFSGPVHLFAGDVCDQPAVDLARTLFLRRDRCLAVGHSTPHPQGEWRRDPRRNPARLVSLSDAGRHPDSQVPGAGEPPAEALGRACRALRRGAQ